MSTVLENERQLAGPDGSIDWTELEKLLHDGNNNNGDRGDDDGGEGGLPDKPEFNWHGIKVAFAIGGILVSQAVMDTGITERDPYLGFGGAAAAAAIASSRPLRSYVISVFAEVFRRDESAE